MAVGVGLTAIAVLVLLIQRWFLRDAVESNDIIRHAAEMEPLPNRGQHTESTATQVAPETDVRPDKERAPAGPPVELKSPVDLVVIRCHLNRLAEMVLRQANLDWRVSANSPASEFPGVTLTVENMPADAALRWACRKAGYSYRIGEKGIILVPNAKVRMPSPSPDEAARAWEAKTRRALAAPVSVNFADCDLDYALQIVSRTTGVNVILDRDTDPATKVRFVAEGEPLEEVLRSVCREAGLVFALVDSAVFLGSGEAVTQVAGDTPVTEEDVF